MKIRKLDHHVVHLAPDPPPKTEVWEFNGQSYRSVVPQRERIRVKGHLITYVSPTMARCGAQLRGRVITVPARTKVTCPTCREF